jgi:tRNA (cytidine/uridine-2'-O-)-methyltransferase
VFNVVLVEPEIPNNTGNIGRTCVATGSTLHLVHPLGFDTSEKACRRAGLDYWPRLSVFEHPSWDALLAARPQHTPQHTWYFSTKATRSLFDAVIAPGDWLIFGSETRGLPAPILAANPDRLLTLPMVHGERSLNLATAVCTVIYEGVRQALARGQAHLDPDGRLHPGIPGAR